MQIALLPGGDAGVFNEVDLERLAHANEVTVGSRHDDSPAIDKTHWLKSSDHPRVPSSVAVEEHLVSCRVDPKEGHDSIGHGELDVLAPIPALAREQRRGDRLGGVESSDLVGNGLAEERGGAAGRVGLVHGDAGIGLNRRVVGAAIRGTDPQGRIP